MKQTFIAPCFSAIRPLKDLRSRRIQGAVPLDRSRASQRARLAKPTHNLESHPTMSGNRSPVPLPPFAPAFLRVRPTAVDSAVRPLKARPAATPCTRRPTTRLFGCLRRAVLALGCVLVAPLWMAAQDGAGTIAGRVQTGGRFLHNARVTVDAANREVFTNAAGEYRITGVPAGAVEVDVFHTGFEPQTATVQVASGAVAARDFVLARRGEVDAEGSVQLAEFVVAGEREYNAQAIAINEQRFSPNLKNVVSTDAFGDINQGNIGEFLKHVPGVTIEVKDGNTPSGIQVRGFNSNYTNVTIDGGTIASTAMANTQFHSRQFVLEQANINNLSRIEVVKVPTPDMPANSLGGSVNLVSRSAFERERAELSFKAYLTANSEGLSFGKRAGAGRVKERTILPSLDLTYVLPVNERFGIVATFSHNEQFYIQDQSVPLHRWDGNGATVENPQTHEFRWSTGGNRTERTSASVKLDWKPAEGHLLEFTAQANAFRQETTNRQLTLRVGNNPADWGETFIHGSTYTPGTSGAPGGSLSGGTQLRHGLTRALGLRYTLNRGPWSAELGSNLSFSNNLVRDHEKGFFGSVGTTLVGASRIDFDDINNANGSVGRVTVYDADGDPMDPTSLTNYRMTNATGQHWEAEDELFDVRGSLRRTFDAATGPIGVKAGFAITDLERAIDYVPMQWDYVGADGVGNTEDDILQPYRDPIYSGLAPGHGRPPQEWPSPWLAHASLVDNPSWFARPSNREGDTIRNNAVRSPLVAETISAGYLMADARLLQNRLRLTGGVRYELTENEGWGMRQDNDAVYQRDAAGNLVRDDEGDPIRRPEAGAPGSGEDARLRYLYRAQYNKRDYDGTYPSLSASYNFTDSLLLRLGYAKTIGRPRTVDVVPTISVTTNLDFSSGGSSAPGWVSSSNTSLKPWEADNFDISLEYYLPGNGVVSAGVFRKDITDFFGTLRSVVDEALIEELGLTEQELGYEYTTRINVGAARIDGIELNYNQALGFLGGWAEPFTLMANYTRLNLSGENEADFSDFIPKAGNIGLQMNFGRLSAFLKWNYRGRQLRELKDDFPGAAEYIRSREQIDANIEYQLSDRFSIFVAGRNITNETNEWEVAGPVAPSWSFMQSHSRFGAQYSFGVRGTF